MYILSFRVELAMPKSLLFICVTFCGYSMVICMVVKLNSSMGFNCPMCCIQYDIRDHLKSVMFILYII